MSRSETAHEMILTWTERKFAVLGVLVLSGAFFALLLRGDVAGGVIWAEGDPELRYPRLTLYAITAVLLLIRAPLLASHLARSWPVLLVPGLAILSAAWSDDPGVTLRRSMALLGTTAFGLYLAARFSIRQILLFFAWSLGICAVSSIIFALMLPEFGLMHGFHEGAWRGVFIHKNLLAYNMAWAAAIFAILALHERRHRLVLLGGMTLATLLIVVSQSVGGLVLLLSLPPILVLASIATRPGSSILSLSAVALAATIAIGVVAAIQIESLVESLGREQTLTGRMDVWDIGWSMIQDRFWKGYGYGVFWIGSSYGLSVFESLGWYPSDSHNGWLELWLNLGLLGVVTMAACFFAALLAAVRRGSEERSMRTYSVLVLLLLLLVMNLAESRLVQSNAIHWVIFVTMASLALGQRKGIEQGSRSTALPAVNPEAPFVRSRM